MSLDDFWFCLAVMVFPYCLLLGFRLPFDLRIDVTKLSRFPTILCRLVWPMVIGAGVLLGGAAYAHRHAPATLENGLLCSAIFLIVLLFVPGLIGFNQAYSSGRSQ
jgi:hypothetical protein